MRIARGLALAAALTCAGCPGDSGSAPTPPRPGEPAARGSEAPAPKPGDATAPPTPTTAPGPSGPDRGPAGAARAPVEPISPASLAPIDEPTLRGWLQGALTRPPAAFAPSAPAWDQLVKYLLESSGACSLFIQHDVDPHRGAPGGAWTAHVAQGEGDLDLLRCEYRAGDLDLVLTEGANFLALEVRSPVVLNERGIKSLLERVVQLKAPADAGRGRAWRLTIPSDVKLIAGTHRFTNAGAPPVDEVQSRDDRVDVLAIDGRLVLVFYKKIEQLVGFGPDDAWFDAATRAKLR